MPGNPEQIVSWAAPKACVGSDVCRDRAEGDVFEIHDRCPGAAKQGIRANSAPRTWPVEEGRHALTGGTLESTASVAGQPRRAARPGVTDAAPARSRAVPVNHGGDFPGGSLRLRGTDERADMRPNSSPCAARRRCWYYHRRRGQASSDTFASYGCLAKGTCAPDPACAPTIASPWRRRQLEEHAWVAKDWSGAANAAAIQILITDIIKLRTTPSA